MSIRKNPVAYLAVCTAFGGTLAAGGSLAAAQSAAVRDAQVSGVVRACGGPYPGRCFPVAGQISARRSGRVVAKHRLMKGHYSFQLVPGRYTLVVKLTRPGRGTQSRTVDAKAHHNTRKNFYFPIR